MKTLLHLDSSLRAANSVSRLLTAEFVAAWRQRFPDGRIVRRDLAADPTPHLTPAFVTGAERRPGETLTAEEQDALRLSDGLIDEVFAADHLVIGTPMYNFTVPSTLKAWTDQIVRAGRTFAFAADGFQPLVLGKKVTVISASGAGYGPDSPWRGMDHLGEWLRAVLGFLGMTETTVIAAEKMDMNPQGRDAVLAQARAQIHANVAAL